ncbi:MAG: DUF3291 domain-containing protein [Burkholderiales bacterium]|nr:DUF3291 domain-containing protein [Burkholderiales bacterium]
MSAYHLAQLNVGIDEAMARLAHLRAHGPTPRAFTFRQAFPPPDAAHAPSPAAPGTLSLR